MNHDGYPDSYIRGILNTVKTIAMVGISPKDNRPSYFVFKYLQERGFRMIPVNPGQAGKEILGQKVYGKLADIPEAIDMVDIFRASAHVLPIVQEALALDPKPKVIWMQLTVRNEDAARLAQAAGLKVVMTVDCRRRFPGWGSIRACSPPSAHKGSAKACSAWGSAMKRCGAARRRPPIARKKAKKTTAKKSGRAGNKFRASANT